MTEQQTETAPPPPIVFVDTETTGLGPERQPWEIGLIRRAPDGTETEHHWYLPIDVRHADPFALRMGGFWGRHPLGVNMASPMQERVFVALPNEEGVAAELFHLTHDAIWVGANPAFDAELIERMIRQTRVFPTWRYHLVDTTVLALGWLHARADAGLGERPPVKYRSDELAAALGIEPPSTTERHTALGDARWCQRIYDRVTGRAAAVAS